MMTDTEARSQADLIAALDRITSAVKDTPFAETPYGAIGLLLIGAAIGYSITRSKEHKENESQRKLLIALLGDEIVLRWHHLIAKYFKPILENNDIKELDKICRTRLKTEDLFIFKHCAENISFTSTLKDNFVVSRVIHVHMLSRDLIDKIDELSETHETYSRGCIDKKAVDEKWLALKCTFEEMNKEMLSIFGKIEEGYNKYINSRDASAVNFNLPELDKKIEDITKRRLCGK
jgi:hypothetical protein